jgi:hypothetical protein
MKNIILLLSLLFGCTPAAAGVPCALPFNLQNGQPADATQVMSNYNALVTCLGNAAAAGVNSDITQLTSIIVPITPSAGGSQSFFAISPTTDTSGLGNAQKIDTTLPSPFVLTLGYQVLFIAGVGNTGATTLSVAGGSPTAILKQTATGLQELVGGEIVANQLYEVVFDGVEFQLLNNTGLPPPAQQLLRVMPLVSAYIMSVADDCGKFFSMGGNAFYTLNIDPSFIPPTGCVVRIYDADTVRGKGLSIAGRSMRLFPGQSYVFTYDGTTWSQAPQTQLWQTPGTFTVNHLGGSDDPLLSDCLATSAGACSTFQNAVNIIQTQTFPPQGGPTIQADCEAHYGADAYGPANSIQVYRGLGSLINFVGNASAPSACALISSAGTVILDVQDGQQVTVTGFEFGYAGSGSAAVNARQIVILDLNNVIFGSNIGGVDVSATDLASVNVVDVSVQGNADIFVAASFGASVQVDNISVPGGASANISFWYDATNNAQIGGNPAYSIGGTVAGAKYACSTNATIQFSSPYPAALTAGQGGYLYSSGTFAPPASWSGCFVNPQ